MLRGRNDIDNYVYPSFRCKLTVKDIRMSSPSPAPHGDGAKTQGHALYNRPLDAHARRRRSSQEVSKIFICFILKSLDFFIKENVVSLFHWALFVLNFDFVSKICQNHRQNLRIAPTNTGNNIFFDEKVQRFQNKVYKYFAFLLGGSKSFLLLFRLRACASNGRL